MNKYKCLEQEEFQENSYKLVAVRKEDVQLIRMWRNEQIDILRQNKIISEKEQEEYYENVLKKSFEESTPALIIFSFMHKNECIGYGGLVNIDWKSKKAEVSFLLKTSRLDKPDKYKIEFKIFLAIIKKIAFAELKLHRLYTETFENRKLHIQVFEEVGFNLEGRLREAELIKGKYVDSLIHGCVKGIDKT